MTGRDRAVELFQAIAQGMDLQGTAGAWPEPRGYSFLARVVRQVVAQDMLTPGQRQRVVDAAARLSAASPQASRT